MNSEHTTSSSKIFMYIALGIVMLIGVVGLLLASQLDATEDESVASSKEVHAQHIDGYVIPNGYLQTYSDEQLQALKEYCAQEDRIEGEEGYDCLALRASNQE